VFYITTYKKIDSSVKLIEKLIDSLETSEKIFAKSSQKPQI